MEFKKERKKERKKGVQVNKRHVHWKYEESKEQNRIQIKIYVDWKKKKRRGVRERKK